MEWIIRGVRGVGLVHSEGVRLGVKKPVGLMSLINFYNNQ